MKNTSKASSLTTLILNVRYMFSKYLVSHALFTAPYIVALSYGLTGLAGQFMGYASLAVWFAWGLSKTKQPIFVWPIFVLFMGSQVAYYADMHTLDLGLTFSCVIIMCAKQYQARHHVVAFMQSHQPSNKASGTI
ncbi:MAG TPA: hypothetical protein DCR37_09645 [Glaciecola sp.]|nr:hypothetical protein [Glaciecola sp.]